MQERLRIFLKNRAEKLLEIGIMYAICGIVLNLTMSIFSQVFSSELGVIGIGYTSFFWFGYLIFLIGMVLVLFHFYFRPGRPYLFVGVFGILCMLFSVAGVLTASDLKSVSGGLALIGATFFAFILAVLVLDGVNNPVPRTRSSIE